MSQTHEDRIRLEYKSLKGGLSMKNYPRDTIPRIIMSLACKWKRPCSEIRKIVGWPGPNTRAVLREDVK